MNEELLNRVKGILIGSALGDTIGIYTEFLSPEQALQAYGPVETFSLVEPVTETFQDRHRCRFESRAWTDDTDHTIIIILSYLRNGALLPNDFATRLRTWCEQGLRCLDRLPMGLGRTTGRIVFSKEYLDDPSGTALAHWEKSGCNNAPNGSIMRTSPIGIICINETEEETFRSAIQMGAVTHAGPKCALSVAIVSALVRGLCKGEITTEADVDAVLERAWMYVALSMPEHPLERDEFEKYAFAETLDALVLCDQYMGYVYKALGSGLWALRQTMNGRETFKSAMLKLVMCGGDADTNGAVAGALMGAHCGYQALPPAWRDGMRHRQWFVEKIMALCVVAGIVEGSYDAQADPHTEFDGGKGFLDEEEMKKREMQVMERILLAEQLRREAVEGTKKEKNKTYWRLW